LVLRCVLVIVSFFLLVIFYRVVESFSYIKGMA
jgi:hypothetical protein